MTLEARDERFGGLPDQAIATLVAPGRPDIGATILPRRQPPLAARDLGDYLLSETHCRALALRILAAMPGGGVVIVTDMPQHVRPLLCEAISEAAAARFQIVEIACDGGATADMPTLASAPPLFLIDEAGQLSAAELREICDAAPPSSEWAVVLLAGTDFANRLYLPEQDLLRARITASLCFDTLGDDEVEPFILRRLPAIAEERPLSVATLAAIAELSAGDPRRADRLMRLAVPDAVTGDDIDGGETQEGPAPPLLIAPPARSDGPPRSRRRLGLYALLGALAIVGVAADGFALTQAAIGPRAAAGKTAQLATTDIPVLLARGDAFLRRGDIASARLFYDRAANAGSSTAALRLANTFDPAFLARAGTHGDLADPKAARRWYRRARDLQSR